MFISRRLVQSATSTFLRRRFLHTTKPVHSEDYQTLLNTPLSNVRNIGIIAHIDAGKTTTTERMLFYSGLTSRIGNVDEGDTVTDYLTQEKDRGITIQSAAVTLPWNKHKINLIDTPGHADFTFEVIRSLRVLDGAVTILDGVAGVEAQTEKVWKQAKDLGIPVVAYINKMDREGAGYGRTVKEIVARLGTRVVLVNIPYFVKDQATGQMVFEGVVDILDKTLLLWNTNNNSDGTKVQVIDISNEEKTPELYQQCLECREAVIEQLGEFDEEVINSFFETEDYMKVPADVIKAALRKATLSGYAIPVLCGASFRNIGVQPLLDAVNDYLPSPLDAAVPEVVSAPLFSGKSRKRTQIQDSSLRASIDPKQGLVINKNPHLTTALAFKVIVHPHRGIMIFTRVYSGKLTSGATIINTRTGEKIKIGKLLLMNADVPQEVKQLTAGNIGVITGTDMITTGDTLVTHSISNNPSKLKPNENSAKLLPIEIPPTVFSLAVDPHTQADKRKLEESLKTILKEDPSLKSDYDEESGELILSGMGELHLEITKDRLINDMKVGMDVGKVKVTYKETITSATDVFSKDLDNPNGPGKFSITLSLDSFEGPAEETDFANEEGAMILESDNNILILEPGSTPEVVERALKSDVWSLPVTYDSIMRALHISVNVALQSGGPTARLPLHSMVVRIKEWNIPSELNSATPLIHVGRLCIKDALNSLPKSSTTILEPLMNVSVFVNDQDLGVVSQDLMTARNANIMGIFDEMASSNSGEDAIWAKEQAEKTYVPHDPTMQYLNTTQSNGKKVISAEAPLKDMIGYLPKIRSLTKGRGIYDMEYKGMQRATEERLRRIIEDETE
ncbi:hypothetical protein CANARDRAFT_28923 [[Candida] arabinofermentans NRRL YB-2248]|uniref:Ribosome-releasing factor 2, mitochondrial n=1 Tax=[Candida] arabinofermentans NRRL YB-2248 TaxID=983967 RepID=A0A1E4SZ75_9ASCO|nr:hypothetical protein CANARDRAFT_28923 [[Candida] arabinofermentans NRRL YB-2248]